MTDSLFYNALLVGVFVAAPLTAASLSFTTAPYGRHNRKRTGPALPTRVGWVYMECPSVFAFAWFFFTGTESSRTVPLLLFALWEAHYVQRTLIYPFLMRVRSGDTMPFAIATGGFVFNCVNSYLNASWIGGLGRYETAWLGDPRFLVGAAVFAAGYVINRHSDAILRDLRAPGETGYKIPRGGLYRWVSSPNYFGELLIWSGWALATWSLAGLSFALYTAANLLPRAVAHHRWYREKFVDYPAERRAVIPYLL
jgi:hypothetical protein